MQFPEWDLGLAATEVIRNPLVFRHLGIITDLETMDYGHLFTKCPLHFQVLGLAAMIKMSIVSSFENNPLKWFLPLLFLLGQTDKTVQAGFLSPLSDSVWTASASFPDSSLTFLSLCQHIKATQGG